MIVSIKGEEWKLSWLRDEDYKAFSGGDDSEGACKYATKHIAIHEDHVNAPTVIHELVHAFVDECHTAHLHLTSDQVEELCCEIIAHHGKTMFDIAREFVEQASQQKQPEQHIQPVT